MSCWNAIDPSEKANQALAVERLRTRFRGQVLDTFLLYLFTYEMPIDRCRSLLDKVATQALLGFPDLAHASWRADAAGELLERLLGIENSMAKKAMARLDELPLVGEAKPNAPEADKAEHALRSRMLSWLSGHGNCPKCSGPRPPVVAEGAWLCPSCDFIYRQNQIDPPEGALVP